MLFHLQAVGFQGRLSHPRPARVNLLFCAPARPKFALFDSICFFNRSDSALCFKPLGSPRVRPVQCHFGATGDAANRSMPGGGRTHFIEN
jgi:hypothetical protein